MFLEDDKMRIPVTPALRRFIIKERENNKVSTLKLATKMDRPQSWLAQIESGRTKTIKKIDLVSIFQALLGVSIEEADKYIEDNQGKFLLAGIEKVTNEEVLDLSFDGKQKGSGEVRVFKAGEPKSDNALLKEEYMRLVRHLNRGLEVFFDKIDDKDDALNIINAFIVNMHCDMGFTLSVTALPLCRMERVEDEIKKRVFHEFAELIKANGTFCSADEDREKRKASKKE
jgi:transcriptional regulator with XRE-family HTH domain